MGNELIQFNKAKSALAEIVTIDDAKDVRDKAAAIGIYLKRIDASHELQNEAADIKVRAERKGGEILRRMEKNKGGRPKENRSHHGTGLSDLGLNKNQSSRWQTIESIPIKVFDEYLADVKSSGDVLTSSKLVQLGKRLVNAAKLKRIDEAEPIEVVGIYDTIVIDPPWPMQKIDRECRPNQVDFGYPTMTEDELCDLKIPAADDCHFWLWTTHRFLPMAFRLLTSWGLKYVCVFVWHKPGGFQPVGLPQYNCEFALYARKGTPQFKTTKALKLCFEAKRGAHSEKPEEFYDMVRRVTAGRRLDMFNRREIEGFDGWGKESPVDG